MRALTAGAQLAQWIEQEHPELFSALYAQAIARGAGSQPIRMRGLGDDLLPGDLDTSSWTPPDVTVWSAPTEGDMASMDVALDSPNIDLSSIGNTAQIDATNALSTIGSGITNAASQVGNWITTSQGASALANLTTALVQNNTQRQVLTGQVQRASAGIAPAPITYAQGANGQIVPVVTSAAALPVGVLASGQVTPVPLSNGTTGYAVAPPIAVQTAGLSSFGNLPWLWFLAAGLALAIVL